MDAGRAERSGAGPDRHLPFLEVREERVPFRVGLEVIRDNLKAHIVEAKGEGWLVEVEVRQTSTVALSLPTFTSLAGRTSPPARADGSQPTNVVVRAGQDPASCVASGCPVDMMP
jgi:hypothetical protein